jgi:hypothetical protein
MGLPAWISRPTWYQVSSRDEAIPPHAQRAFAFRTGARTTEVPAGHLAMVCQPETAQLIKTAAECRVAMPAGKAGR